MLSVARLVSFWRCIPLQYNCQKSSNFQGLSHFSRIFGKNDKIPGFFQAGKIVTIFPGFPGAVGTLCSVSVTLCSFDDSYLIFSFFGCFHFLVYLAMFLQCFPAYLAFFCYLYDFIIYFVIFRCWLPRC